MARPYVSPFVALHGWRSHLGFYSIFFSHVAIAWALVDRLTATLTAAQIVAPSNVFILFPSSFRAPVGFKWNARSQKIYLIWRL